MRLLLLVMFIGADISTLYSQKITRVEINSAASFRGISVVDDSVAWIGGTNGTIGVTNDGGVSWNIRSVDNFRTSDFRSVYAFDCQRALIVNAGSPVNVMLTENGGKQWRVVYANNHAAAFVDGIDFWNEKDGIIYGDPIDGKMLLLRTSDGGETWEKVATAPALEPGEASFAASGTGIRCIGQHEIVICTGGKISRAWISDDRGVHWTNRKAPIIQGDLSTGIFSVTKINKRLIIVGGDFKNDSLSLNNNFYSDDDGQTWIAPEKTTQGYRECVEVSADRTLFAVGPSGIDISDNRGVTWKKFSNEKKLHVIRRARHGSLLIAGGGGGKLLVIR